MVYLPIDEFSHGKVPNLDLAADYLELKAFFSATYQALSKDIVDAFEISADEDYKDVDDEIKFREDVANGSALRIQARQRILKSSYPFDVDEDGSVISYTPEGLTYGQAAYLISLVLSHLRSITPMLGDSDLHPSDGEVRVLRQHFQYFATAAMAAEMGGPAWSFGHPRPDGSGFEEKLTEIWSHFNDGQVQPDASAPSSPKDGQVDVFARRLTRDRLPGFLFAAGQVATGANWKDKPVRMQAQDVFEKRWFVRPPVTRFIAYHLIPFVRDDSEFRDDVLNLGNILHRLRLPYRVDEAADLVEQGIAVEAYDLLNAAVDWVNDYRQRGLA